MRTEILDAWDHRVADVIDLIHLYGMEQLSLGYYQGTYSRENSIRTIYEHWQDPRSDIIIIYDDDVIVGCAQVQYFFDHCVEFIGNLSLFYIQPSRRGTQAGRLLRDACISWFDDKGCVISVAQDVAHIGEQGRFANLLKKRGYEELGPVLIRRHTVHE